MVAYSSVDASAVISKPGQANLAGDLYAMMIEEFTGQVLVSMQFESDTAGLFPWTQLVGTDTLSNAGMGRPKLTTLDAGISPSASKIEVGAQTLQVRQPIICRVAIGVMDDVQDRLNIRGRQPMEMGKVISEMTDQVLLHQTIKSALMTTGMVADLKGGTKIEMGAIGDELLGDKLERQYRYLAEAMMIKQNRIEGGVLFQGPTQYFSLFDSDKLINSQFSPGNGNFAATSILKAANMGMKTTNRITQAAQDGAGSTTFSDLFGTDYVVTAEHAKAIAVFAKPDALMIAEAIPMTTEIWWDSSNKTHVLDVYTAFAAGPNNPAEAGVVLKKTA
jgi:hypothetical protein